MSPLIESVIFIPIFLVLFGSSMVLSVTSISHSIVQWGCYRLARLSLVNAPAYLIEEEKRLLRLMPLAQEPLVKIMKTEQESTVTIHQTLEIFGKSYELKERFTLHQ